jgi:hypothetical protein
MTTDTTPTNAVPEFSPEREKLPAESPDLLSPKASFTAELHRIGAGLESAARAIGKSHLDCGDDVPEWVWEEIEIAIAMQGENCLELLAGSR